MSRTPINLGPSNSVIAAYQAGVQERRAKERELQRQAELQAQIDRETEQAIKDEAFREKQFQLEEQRIQSQIKQTETASALEAAIRALALSRESAEVGATGLPPEVGGVSIPQVTPESIGEAQRELNAPERLAEFEQAQEIMRLEQENRLEAIARTSELNPSEELLAYKASDPEDPTSDIARDALELLSSTTGAGLTANAAFDISSGVSIGKGIASGQFPPDLRALRAAPKALASALDYLQTETDFDLSTATSEWNATQTFLRSINSDGQLSVRQQVGFLVGNGTSENPGAVELLEDLVERWHEASGGDWQLINRIKQGTQVQAGGELGAIAQNLIGHVNEMIFSLATIYGGKAPTDKSLELAQTNLNAAWSKEVMDESIATMRRSLKYRINAVIHAAPITEPGDLSLESQLEPTGSEVEEIEIPFNELIGQ